MSPFHDRCPEVAGSEMLVLHIKDNGLPLPPGEYAFFEWYCTDAGCDCRRALLQVLSPQHPGRALATLNYGWESAAFYTEWMHGDETAGQEITSASLDPLHPRSELADALLDGFRDYVRLDSYYPQQLQRHYELFKSTQTTAPTQTPEPTPVPAMTTEGILRQLQHVPDHADFAPYEAAMLAAISQRDAIVPELIAALDRVTADPATYLRSGNEDYLHSFAIYLLAQFRETRALDTFLRFFSLPGDQSLDLTGDMVTEHGAAVLASVCGGDPAPLLKLIHDESVNEFVRAQAIDALAVQSLWGERPREAVVADLRALFKTLPKPGNAYVWAGLAGLICDFHAPELAPEARQAFAEELVDESVLDLHWLEESLFQRGGKSLEYFRECNAPIDAVNECSAWLCFRDENEDLPLWDDNEAIDTEARQDDALGWTPGEPPYRPPAVPYVAPLKVGRNKPCPCGSGKKYKKCCGKN